MKTSIKILKLCLALLVFAVVLAALGAGAYEGLLGISLAFPLLIANYETSDDAKAKRSELYDEMQKLINIRKQQKRQFDTGEQARYDELKTDFDQLTKHIETLEADEKRALIMAGKFSLERTDFPGASVQRRETNWQNKETGKPVHVFGPEKRCAEVYTTEDPVSLGRAIRAMITSDWRGAENEQRALSTSSGSQLLVPFSVFAPVIDKARELSITMAAGAQTVVMETGKMSLARVIEDPTFEVKSENDLFTGSTIGFDGIELNAQTIGQIVVLSRELAADAPNVAQAIETAIARSLAVYIDKLALMGTGSGQPRGVFHTTNVPMIASGNYPMFYGSLFRLWLAIAENNGNPNAVALCPRDMAILNSLTTEQQFLIQPELLKQTKIMHSTSIPCNLGETEDESIAIMGDFSKLFFGIREDVHFEISNVSGEAFARHQTAIKVTLRADIGVEQPGHFSILHGIKNRESWWVWPPFEIFPGESEPIE